MAVSAPDPPVPQLAEGTTAFAKQHWRAAPLQAPRLGRRLPPVRRGEGGPALRCKRCVGEAVTRRHQKVKRILVAEAGGCCAVCGYKRCVVNLHFHHVVPADKAIAVTVASGKSLDAYRSEARKCVLVCANCHGEIESGLIPSPPAQERFQAA